MLPEPPAPARASPAPARRLPSRRALRALLCALLASLPLSLASCQGRAFGMSLDELAAILAASDPGPILALSEKEIEARGELGPESFYYLARWLEDRASGTPGKPGDPGSPAARRAGKLYRLAFDRAAGLARSEAGRAHARLLAAAGDWAELLAFALEHRASEGPDWAVDRAALDALRELDMPDALLAALEALRSGFPAESSADTGGLLLLEAWARRELGSPGWSLPVRALLLELPASSALPRALALLEGAEPADLPFSAAELRAARMRAAVLERDYGLACRLAAPALGDILSAASSPATAADAGKAFLYGGEARAAAPRFAELEARAREAAAAAGNPALAARARKLAWNALFYRARFALALERWAEAAELLGLAAAEASLPEDADAALWYGLEAASGAARAEAEAAKAKARAASKREKSRAAAAAAADARARRRRLAALAQAAAAWRAPARFEEPANELLREALRAGDWELVLDLAREIAPSLPAETAARLGYAAARALELGRGRAAGAEAREPAWEARSRFLGLAADPRAPLHYRALAAWRSGAELPLLPPELPSPAPPERLPAEEAFVLGFLDYGLPDAAAAEARARAASAGLGPESLRRIAAALAAAGRADGSIRLAAALMERPDWDPRRSDYELLYPRPFLGEYRAISPAPACPEQLLFGLLRSESLFREDVVSHAGAIGLAQLMPPTAAEVARRLGLEAYDLRSAPDNLRLGAAYFSGLLASTGRPLRAMMAYNAGPGRLRAWAAEAGNLPDDLLLEAIGIAETREYGRKIHSASVMYGELYYGIGAARTTRYAVEGGKL
ncbi:MAG TPA: lytic transglycosylase domain-containing protein [Spirochaetales bacterium]|nr:lytic transglycosylase domain-containing protein [Spirochaetales bacterium]HRZ65300.1 lytic transglycosylase domain-containing protein [Spirochaetia bacterium]